jgi:hypothetical protein
MMTVQALMARSGNGDFPHRSAMPGSSVRRLA